MISIELYPNPAENPEIVKLVFYSMRNKYTRESNPDGLTFKEVRSIISSQPVHVIRNNGKIVGLVNTSDVNFSLKKRLNLPDDFEYHNVGMIYIAKKERGNGFASVVVKQLLEQHKNLIYIVHESNLSSNKIATRHFEFFKKHSSFRSFESYNIYKVEQ